MTAFGRACGLVPGNVATDTPAASSAGSAPPRRVVFAVASESSENRSSPSSEPESPPSVEKVGPPPPLSPSEQPASSSAHRASTIDPERRSTRRNISIRAARSAAPTRPGLPREALSWR